MDAASASPNILIPIFLIASLLGVAVFGAGWYFGFAAGYREGLADYDDDQNRNGDG